MNMLLDIFPDFDFSPDVREEELNNSYNQASAFFYKQHCYKQRQADNGKNLSKC